MLYMYEATWTSKYKLLEKNKHFAQQNKTNYWPEKVLFLWGRFKTEMLQVCRNTPDPTYVAMCTC